MLSRYDRVFSGRAFARHVRKALIAAVVFLINLHGFFWLLHEPDAYSPPLIETQAASVRIGRVYIASNHWNTSATALGTWSSSLIGLVRALGPKNVFISIYESGSSDDTKAALLKLGGELEKLSVGREIVFEDTKHKEQVDERPKDGEEREGWIMTPEGHKAMRRVPMLAKLRNRVLDPLEKLKVQGEADFSRIMFLDDVVFSPSDALALLRTHDGNYSAACAMDYKQPDQFYDASGLRDIYGREAASQRFPFFGSGISRNVILNNEPVPVKSCWSGMVVFDSTAFLRPNLPLRFRAIRDSLASYHLDASECCLIHADNPSTSSSRSGVWVNPLVRVGYNAMAYDYQQQMMGSWHEWVIGVPVRLRTNLAGLPRRKKKVIGERVKDWKKGQGSGIRREVGEFCLVDESQVMAEDGWRHD